MNDFFSSPKFNGSYFSTFDLLDADTVVNHIRNDVPPQWRGTACEGAYYNLTAKYEGVSDTIQFHLLDKLDAAFPDDSIHAFTQMIRGELFIDLVRYDTASQCLQNAYDLSIKGNRLTRAADIKSVFARLALRQADYPEATKLFMDNYHYFSQLDITEERGRVFQIYKSLINVYRKSHNFEEAHQWCLNAWVYAQSKPANYYALEASTILASSYLQVHQLDSAQRMVDTAFYFQNLFNKNFNEAFRHSTQGKIYLEKGQCSKALVSFQSAKKTNKDQDPVAVNQYDKELADGYTCLRRLDSAIYFYKAALITPDSINQLAVLEALSKVYLLRGDYANAYQYEKQSKDLRNRVFSKEKEQTIGRLQAKSEVERRERLLAEKENRTKLNRVLMLSALLALSLGFIAGLFWVYRKRQELRLATQEKYMLEQEKKLIETQALLQKQALARAEQEIVVKDTALEESSKLIEVKNMLIQKLQMSLTEDSQEPFQEAQLRNLKILTTEDWRTFRALFEQRFPLFFINLNSRFPKLTPGETRLLLLIKLGFDAMEISNVLGISATSVYTSRSRLRKRLGLMEEDDLEQFVERF
ncbi:MAG: hypothetical protein JNL70_02380 [Saprospiraceae bacterium]|nr:hypothetical protein [Saprospiraceae bacterium]